MSPWIDYSLLVVDPYCDYQFASAQRLKPTVDGRRAPLEYRKEKGAHTQRRFFELDVGCVAARDLT
jgi:hypothetical protein